ncbi:MAG: bifunctional oligoribonuclease/PAP phosphatase NrnA [Desulfopila sp.]
MKIPEQFCNAVQNARSVVLFTHVHPDGDALGSLLGMAGILESLNKKVFCYLEEAVPYIYSFLPGKERVNTSLSDLADFTEKNTEVIALSLDCGDCGRLGKNSEKMMEISPFLVMDHHTSHQNFGQHRWVDAARSSTGEMVYELAQYFGAFLSYETAFNLYVAISTDTGSFCYDSTTSRTLAIAAELVQAGVLPNEVSGYIYNNYTPQRIRLLERVLGTLQLDESQTIAMIHVTRAMFAERGALPEDVEGFIDFPRSIKNVEIAVFIKETLYDTISISMRAKGNHDVAAIARKFNGGGHRNAAGFRLPGKTVEEARWMILDSIA